jgi:tetratricopeptide (TPR) repeat protein
MKYETEFDKIDLYLRNKLTLADKNNFEEALLIDNELAKETALRKAEQYAFERLITLDLRQKMRDMDAEVPKETTTKGFEYWLVIAAALLLFLGSFWFFKEKMKTEVQPVVPSKDTLQTPKPIEILTPNNQEVVHETPQIPPQSIKKRQNPPQNKQKTNKPEITISNENNQIAGLITPANMDVLVRGILEDRPVSDTLKRASIAFEKQDYNTALQLLTLLSKENEAEKHWLRGHVFFQQKNYAAAVQEFKALTDLKTDIFRDRDEWMMLLSMISQTGKTDENILSLMKKIEDDEGHPFHLEVKKLRSLLK